MSGFLVEVGFAIRAGWSGNLKNITTGLITSFNALTGGVHNSFWLALTGRLFDTQAPEDAEMPFGVYFIVSDTNDDVFKDEVRSVNVQFSLFSGGASAAEIRDLDTYLSAFLNDNLFAATGWGNIMFYRQQGNGPYKVAKDEVSGTGRYWQYDIDYEGIFTK